MKSPAGQMCVFSQIDSYTDVAQPPDNEMKASYEARILVHSD